MECTITELCDHKLVRKRGNCTEVRYIKDKGWNSVSSFHAYNGYKEAACVPTVRRIAAILQRSVHWSRCDDHYTPWRGTPCIDLEPAEVDKLPVDVGHLVAYRHWHERTAKPHVRHTSRLFVCWPSGTAAPHDVSSMESIRLLFAPCAADEAWRGSASVDFVPSFCLRSVDLERL